jgi:hypothetical protein
MRKIKSFNEYQNINEEIGVKSIATILTSLLLTFKSVEATPLIKPNVTSFSSEEDQEKSMDILNQDMMKIQNDLQKIKNSGYNDEKLNTIINKCIQFNTNSNITESTDDIKEVTNLLHNYIKENNINNNTVIDTLRTIDSNTKMIKSGDYENLTNDYKTLLEDYEKLLTENPDYSKSETGGSATVALAILLFLMLFQVITIKILQR